MNKEYKDIVKEFEKQINIFNNKYKDKYIITYFLDLEDDKCLNLYLNFIKENYVYPFKILIDDLLKYEPEYVIFRLIENGFIEGNK